MKYWIGLIATLCILVACKEEHYGVDVSFPIHHHFAKNPAQQKIYDKLMNGCAKAYSRSECQDTEDRRIDMNLKQAATQHNYTEIGFKKLKLPTEVFKLLSEFYEANVANKHEEVWSRGYTYTNHWVSPTYMISVEDRKLRGAGDNLKASVWDGVKPIIEEWTGHKLRPTSMYGIRMYTDGAILATHVDRLPLVSSCIINVAQDVDEPWPIEVYDHNGVAYNVTMEPGDMVLYESHTVLHGRPFPLKGRYFSNIFVHFEPIDHKEMNELDRIVRMKGANSIRNSNREIDDDVNEYTGEEEEEGDYELVDPKLVANHAAGLGNLGKLKRMLIEDASRIHAADQNGWQPLHEAVRAGHTDIVRYLVEMGADIGAPTKRGGTPLWWARRSLPRGHSTIQYLEGIGAPEEGDL